MKVAIFSPYHMGKAIARLRLLKGMKQATFAKLMGVSQSALSQIEQRSSITLPTLEKAARALGVTVENIYYFSNEFGVESEKNIKSGS